MNRVSRTASLSVLLSLVLSAGLAGGVTGSAPRVSVSVDPRMELYSVVLLLSGFKGPSPQAPALTSFDFPYKREILQHFNPQRDHAAVRLYRELASRGFWLTHPPAVMVHLSDPPELAVRHPVDELRVRMAGGPDSLRMFISEMRNFARDSDFMGFFEEHRAMYERLSADYRQDFDLGFIVRLEDYFGAKQNSYNIILTPLFVGGGFGPRVEVAPGVFDSYFIGGPLSVREDSLPGFHPVMRLIQHEFGHSFINGLTNMHLEELDGPWSVLDAESKPIIESLGFPWPLHVSDQVSENVNRAMTSRQERLASGEAAGQAAVKNEVAQGFPYVPIIYERLEEYEANRGKFPTFREFYPQIVETFQQAAREKAAGR